MAVDCWTITLYVPLIVAPSLFVIVGFCVSLKLIAFEPFPITDPEFVRVKPDVSLTNIVFALPSMVAFSSITTVALSISGL